MGKSRKILDAIASLREAIGALSMRLSQPRPRVVSVLVLGVRLVNDQPGPCCRTVTFSLPANTEYEAAIPDRPYARIAPGAWVVVIGGAQLTGYKLGSDPFYTESSTVLLIPRPIQEGETLRVRVGWPKASA